ncbi:nucleotidyltransferase domain-containing protein [Streptomyces sp. NPDC058657]|uniref:nucleotidyltransferase domain-containing protein n=1 Tax=unclassified Streptomyces TaxID=2593676 RepID=UPI00364D8F2B
MRHPYIEREGSLDRVQEEFRPVVDSLHARVAAVFTADRLHSAYLYGSVPRGTARPGRSDLDVLLALRAEPAEADRADAERIGAGLDAAYGQIDGVGTLLYSEAVLTSELERYDMGWFVACLCTPLLGSDLAERLPRYRPDTLLARETNGDLIDALPRWRKLVADACPGGVARDDEVRRLSRVFARRLVRSGLTLVMPRWGRFTSELTESAEVFARYYPERGDEMRKVAEVAGNPTADPSVLQTYTEDLGPWLAREYIAVHGRKTPRPY